MTKTNPLFFHFQILWPDLNVPLCVFQFSFSINFSNNKAIYFKDHYHRFKYNCHKLKKKKKFSCSRILSKNGLKFGNQTWAGSFEAFLLCSPPQGVRPCLV